MSEDELSELRDEVMKAGSGFGIPFSKIRASAPTISRPPSGTSSMISSFDASSMYPVRMGKSFSIEEKKYHVSNSYPFEIKRSSSMDRIQEDLINRYKDGREPTTESFDRRYDAEKYSLEKLCSWSDGNWEQDLYNKKKLETFDEDHPEWLI